MSKAIERFRQFFTPGSTGAEDAPRKAPRATRRTPPRPATTPPRQPRAAARRTTKTRRTAKATEIPEDLRARSAHYLGLLLARDVRGLVSAVVHDLDKEQILREVAELRAKHPRMSDARLCELLITSASNAMSVAAVGSGLAWAVPGVGIATGSVATAAELVAMIVYQSRLVVSIAAVHGVDIRARERSRDVVVCIASSTAGTAVAMGVRAAVRTLTERLAAALARRTVTAMFKSIPIAGTLAGIAGGAAGALFNRWAVKAVGRYAVRFYSGHRRAKRVPPVASRP